MSEEDERRAKDAWQRINRAREQYLDAIGDELIHWLRKQGVSFDDGGEQKMRDALSNSLR